MAHTKSTPQEHCETTNESETATSEDSSWTNSFLEEPLCSQGKQRPLFLRKAHALKKGGLERSLDAVKQTLDIVDRKVNYTQKLATETSDKLLQDKQQFDQQGKQLAKLSQQIRSLTLHPPLLQSQQTADHLDKRINKVLDQRHSRDSYTQFITDRSSTVAETLQHQIATLQQQQLDIQKLQHSMKQTLQETFNVVNQTMLVVLQNVQHYVAIQTYSHNEYLRVIHHLPDQDRVLTEWVTILHHDQQMHH